MVPARLRALWRRVAAGGHLKRPVAELIRAAGLAIIQIETAYSGDPKLLGHF